MTQEKLSLAVQIAGVIVGIGVAVVAIWGERLRQLWSRPKLHLSLGEPIVNQVKDGRRGWYYLLKIGNRRPSCPAGNVRICLTTIHKKGLDGVWRERAFSGPTQVL